MDGIRITASQVTDIASNYLPLAGGTMTGTLDMNGNVMDNVLKINDSGTHFDENGIINLAFATKISWTNDDNTGIKTLEVSGSDRHGKLITNTDFEIQTNSEQNADLNIYKAFEDQDTAVSNLNFQSFDDAGQRRFYANIACIPRNTSASAADGQLVFNIAENSTSANNVIPYFSCRGQSGDILLNKPLNINGVSIINTGTLTLPTSTDTLVGRATTDTLTNKTLTSPTLTTPVLGTPSSGTLTSCTGLPITGITSSTSAQLKTLISDETGSGALVFANTPTLVTPILDTPTSGTLTNCTGLPLAGLLPAAKTQSFVIAASDETTDLTTGTNKVKFRMPYAFTVTAVRGSLSTVATGATLLTVDINESGSSILSTKLTFDASESTTTTAATPAVISDASLADDAEITIDIDAVGNTTAGKGLKVVLIGYQT